MILGYAVRRYRPINREDYVMRIFPVPSYTGDYIKALRWADIKDATTALDYVANFASYGVFDIVEIDSALGVIE